MPYSLIVLRENGDEVPLNKPGTNLLMVLRDYSFACLWANAWDTHTNLPSHLREFEAEGVAPPLCCYVASEEYARKLIAEAAAINNHEQEGGHLT